MRSKGDIRTFLSKVSNKLVWDRGMGGGECWVRRFFLFSKILLLFLLRYSKFFSREYIPLIPSIWNKFDWSPSFRFSSFKLFNVLFDCDLIVVMKNYLKMIKRTANVVHIIKRYLAHLMRISIFYEVKSFLKFSKIWSPVYYILY